MASEFGVAKTHEFTVEDVEFLKDGDHSLVARVYRPVGPGPYPAVLNVHGGHFVTYDHTANVFMGEQLAGSGIVMVTPGFRMPPDCTYPGSVADVHFAIRWMKENAETLRTAPSMIGGIGMSSGGHTLMLAAMRPDDPRYAAIPLPSRAEVDPRLRFAILFHPIIDPFARYEMAKELNMADRLSGHDAYFASEEEQQEANPTRMLERGEEVELLPVLYHQGLEDDAVTPDMADRFAAAYDKAGGSIRLEKYRDTPHGFTNARNHCPATKQATELTIEFIQQHGGAN